MHIVFLGLLTGLLAALAASQPDPLCRVLLWIAAVLAGCAGLCAVIFDNSGKDGKG